MDVLYLSKLLKIVTQFNLDVIIYVLYKYRCLFKCVLLIRDNADEVTGYL